MHMSADVAINPPRNFTRYFGEVMCLLQVTVAKKQPLLNGRELRPALATPPVPPVVLDLMFVIWRLPAPSPPVISLPASTSARLVLALSDSLPPAERVRSAAYLTDSVIAIARFKSRVALVPSPKKGINNVVRLNLLCKKVNQ